MSCWATTATSRRALPMGEASWLALVPAAWWTNSTARMASWQACEQASRTSARCRRLATPPAHTVSHSSMTASITKALALRRAASARA